MVFPPADGVKSRRKKVYEYAAGLELGAFVSYGELGELLVTPDNHSIQASVSVANRELRRWHSKELSSNRCDGYTLKSYDQYEPRLNRQEKERVRSYLNYHQSGASRIADLLGDLRDSVTLDFVYYCNRQRRILRTYVVLFKFDPEWEETLKVRDEYRMARLRFSAALHLRLWRLDPRDRQQVAEWFLGTG